MAPKPTDLNVSLTLHGDNADLVREIAEAAGVRPAAVLRAAVTAISESPLMRGGVERRIVSTWGGRRPGAGRKA